MKQKIWITVAACISLGSLTACNGNSVNETLIDTKVKPINTPGKGNQKDKDTIIVEDPVTEEPVVEVPVVDDPVVVLPQDNRVEAESFTDSFGDIELENSGSTLGSFDGGDYLVYSNVDLTGVKQVTTSYATLNENSHIELRLDANDGPLLAVTKLDSTGDWQSFIEKTADVINSASGVHDVYVLGVESAGDFVGNLDYFIFDAQNSSDVGNDQYVLDEQSSGFCFVNGETNSNNEGFTGSGFINTDNTMGSSILWSINANQAGVYPVEIRYASGGETARPGLITVDGAGSQTLTFNSTGAWTSWQTETINIALESGDNAILIKANGMDGLANIDKITLTGNGLSDAQCAEIDNPTIDNPTIDNPTEHSGPLLSQNGNPVLRSYNRYKNWSKDKAGIILSHQYDNGGWPKNQNYDSMGSGGSGVGTNVANGASIDNEATTTEMTFLADIYRQDGNTKYRDAARKAMDYLLEAQYPSGGWPQVYPLVGGYADRVTFNDNAMIRVLTVLNQAVNQSAPFDTDIFSDNDRIEFQQAIDKGVNYILKSQWVQNGMLTVWCAQHGETDYQPKLGRLYELPSLSGNESANIIGFLMTQPQSVEIKAAIKGALAWFRSPDTYLADYTYVINSVEKIKYSSGSKMWFRFYELSTNRPIFGDRDGGTYYDIMDISEERRNGYTWASSNYGVSILNYAESVGY